MFFRSEKHFSAYKKVYICQKNKNLIELMGVENWKKLNKYHRRSLVETAFYRFKQILGDKLMSRTYDAQRSEVSIKCRILNKIIKNTMA